MTSIDCGRRLFWLFMMVLAWTPNFPALAQESSEALASQARQAFNEGNVPRALELLGQGIRQDPKNRLALSMRARIHEIQRDYEKAIEDYTRLLALNDKDAEAYQQRGSAHFKAGHIRESIADFDRFLELVPAQEPHHWQRGISYYYAGEFEKGQRQFESHQTVNDNDVENAVWHFLCVARLSGVEKARASLIQIRRDSRVPMMEVYALFAGKTDAEGVWKAAQAGQPSEEELRHRTFYAHLYLGLYYEALGESEKSADHIRQAAEDYPVGHYMWDVARVHAQLRGNKK